jgi:SAM-dependent methyltransferase
MIKKLASKLLRLVVFSRLRAKHYRRPLNLKELSDRCSLNVDRSLDIGSGPNPKNPFEAKSLFGVDIRSWDVSENVKRCLLGSEPIPFESNFFDAVTAYDVLEHIPRVATEKKAVVFPFVLAMNEIWRVLKVDGLFFSETPCYPMQEAFQDPTHVNIMTEDTLRLYFAENAWARIYGFIGCFSLVAEGWRGSHYFCVLKKTSDVPLLLINEPQAR